MSMSTVQVIVLIAIIVFAWLAFWIALLRLIARFGGWRTLAMAYPLPPRSPLDAHEQTATALASYSMQSLRLCRWVGYNNAITFRVEREGLVLRVFSILSPGHQPMLIPWSQFTATPTSMLGMKTVRLQTLSAPQIPVTISAKLAARLKDAAGDLWTAGDVVG